MKKKLHKLSDEFDNGQADHFTHYDYLKQLIVNGQASAYQNHLEEMDNDALISLSRIIEKSLYANYVRAELLKRMGN